MWDFLRIIKKKIPQGLLCLGERRLLIVRPSAVLPVMERSWGAQVTQAPEAAPRGSPGQALQRLGRGGNFH